MLDLFDEAAVLAEHDGLEQLGEPKDRGSLAKDDRLDVLAMAVAYWNESMARDEAKVQAEHRSKMQDLELRKFMESFTGAGSSSTWSSLKDHTSMRKTKASSSFITCG